MKRFTFVISLLSLFVLMVLLLLWPFPSCEDPERRQFALMRGEFQTAAREFYRSNGRWPSAAEIKEMATGSRWGRNGLSVQPLSVNQDGMEVRFRWKLGDSRFEGKAWAITYRLHPLDIEVIKPTNGG